MPEPASSLKPLLQPRAREAQLLADMLRISRLTVLYGAAGAGKTALLTTGVLPLLRRRVSDRKLPQPWEPRVVVPFPQCRRADRTHAELAVYFDEWDGLPLEALSARLIAALPAGGPQVTAPMPALADNLALWSKQFRARFVILLDQFEQYLTAPRDRPGILDFGHEFARVLDDPGLGVNFLVSVREDAEPLMERLRAGVSGLGDASLRLYPPEAPRPAMVPPRQESLRAAMAAAPLAPATVTPFERTVHDDAAFPELAAEVEEATTPGNDGVARLADTAANAGATSLMTTSASDADIVMPLDAEQSPVAEVPPPAPLPEAEPQASVDETTALPEADADTEEVQPGDTFSEPAPEAQEELRMAEALPPAEPHAHEIVVPATPVESASAEQQPVLELPNARSASVRTWVPTLKWLAGSGAFVALLVIIWAAQHYPAEPLPPRVALQAPEPSEASAEPAPVAAQAPLPAPSQPQIILSIESGNSTDVEIAKDLARVVGRDVGAEIAVRSETPHWRDEETPSLAIMRYEALDAASRARARAPAAYDRLRVVTPLYTEEIYVIVRRDSPLTFLHEMRETRINVGADRGSRGLTAARLYERMFGTPLQAANISTLADDEALVKLLKERSIDAMIVVAGQPAKWLSNLAPEHAQSIKLLKLDPAHPAGQKAIEAYLPTLVRAAHYPKWLSEDVPALATMSFLVTADYTEPTATERLDTFMRSLCRNVEVLRQQGHPKWREVQLGFELETGWAYSPLARNVLKDCPRP